MSKKIVRTFIVVSLAISLTVAARDNKPDYTDSPHPNNVYWGDTHLHTNLSLDAYTYGNVNLGPESAYRFAKGEAIKSNNGMIAQLKRPLDFLVIADHASNMGLMQKLEEKAPILQTTPLGKLLSSKFDAIGKASKYSNSSAVKLSHKLALEGLAVGQVLDDATQKGIWAEVAELADDHNNPGQFTTFIGFEWTQVFYNLHRVVIFKDGASKASSVLPFSQYDSSDPEDLWKYLDNYESQTKGEVLAIPHNGNLSQGVMFALEGADGKPLTAEYAKTRSRWEPLFEVTQIKGDSEAHPYLSFEDSFSDYETVPVDSLHRDFSEEFKKQRVLTDYNSWIGKKIKSGDMSWNYTYGYARPALKLGIQQQVKLGINPFKFGMIGSTDSHTSLSTADNNNFLGKSSRVEPNPTRVLGPWGGPEVVSTSDGFYSKAWSMNASGYAAVWAHENTRESIFAAMKRKEVYASTGPRITVRFFGGWDYEPVDAFSSNLAKIGYDKGVPMGGDLAYAPQGQSPQFLIRAVKDPEGANLDRAQVIKGWLDKQGRLHEKVYNVILSDGRIENIEGAVRPVGNTVDIADASYTNSIGDPELAIVWEDPDFDKEQLAFYYVRVLEIPTPRWTAYDVKFFGLKNIPIEVPMVTQERVYTSPIWYTPNSLK